MEYDKINANETVIDESSEKDMLFIEHCRKFDKRLADIIKNIEVDDKQHSLSDGKLSALNSTIDF